MISIRGALSCALLIMLAAAPAAPGQGAPPAPATAARVPGELLLSDLYDLARARNPRLQAAEAGVAASRAREASASLPPDPMVEVGAMNFSVPGFRTDMATSMAPAVQATQTIPFPGKLGLSGKIARQATAAEGADAAEGWWEVRAQVAATFYELYNIDRTLAVMTETLGLLQNFEAVARSLYASGSGRQADVLRATVEVARMRSELARLEARRIGAAARLNAILDRPANTPVPSPALALLPLVFPGADTLQSWAESSRPLLEGARIRVEQAETRRALARKEIWPDLSLGLQYGQNRGLMGTDRMGSVMLGFSLPVFAGRRQLQAREEAAALERAARAELSGERAHVAARVRELAANLEQTRTLISLYRREVLPQAEANVASALSAYRAGTVDFLTLIDAQLGHNGYQRELHALVAEYGATVAELERTLGRELPATGNILAEVL